ncbi:unnamed protein product [Adineta steineri]|uniref:Uncharacterized protein n=1 Tax=Adineta steineri TaxID=433720 RepID=A0A814TXH3_9BILA|nr:unnamed protein product [Adineta steineri]
MHLMKFNVLNAVKLLRGHWRHSQSDAHNQSVESLTMIMPPMINQLLEDLDQDKYSMQQLLVNQKNTCDNSNNTNINKIPMMATAALPNDDFNTNTDDKSLEIFSLIWLDANINVKETRGTEQKLRSIINHIKKFQDIKQCQQYIEQRSQQDRLILIVSGRLGREIVPDIHQLRQVISVYVYCMDEKSNEQWTFKFSKVKFF